jgi:protein-tyrosine phosphatase
VRTRLRRILDRAVHALRRRRVHAALARRSPATLLVVCHGNLCRSPFAAAVLARALKDTGMRVESGGFVAPSRPSPPEAVAVAARRGVDLSAHRPRGLTAELVHSADLVVVMDAAQQRELCHRFGRLPRDVLMLGDLDPVPIAARAIRDPVGQGVEVFEESYARIERCAAALGRVLVAQR